MSQGLKEVLVLCGLAIATANAQTSAHGFLKADAAGCQLWAPSMFQGDDHVAHYTGACKSGLAEGKGKADWTSPTGGSHATWNGIFHNGVFTGDRVISFPIVPVGGDDYLVDWGNVGGGELIEVATGPQTGGMELCRTEYLGIKLAASVAVADDEAIRSSMKNAVVRFEEMCPKASYRVSVGAFNTAMEWHTSNFRAEPVAHAFVTLGTTELEQYVNKAIATAKQKDRQGAFEAKRAAGHQAFDAFSAKNGIVAWVTTEQLDQNPFKFQGKVVGVFVQLDRMLSPNTALVQSGVEDGYGEIELRGITPDFPGKPKAAMLAVRVGKQEKLDVLGVFKTTITVVDKADSFVCAERECDDVLRWQIRGRKIAWGEPYVQQP